MRHYVSRSTSSRRIPLRPALLPRAASTCLLSFLSVAWLCEQFLPVTVLNLVSAAVAHMPAGPYAAAPAFQQPTPVLAHPQEKKALMPVPAAPAASPASAYQFPRTGSVVPASPVSLSTVFCPPVTYSRDTQMFTPTAGSAPSGAAATEPPAVRLSTKTVSSIAVPTVPECTVRPLALPATTVGTPPSNVVVMPRPTGSIQTPATAPGRSSRAGTYMAVTETPGGTVVQQQSLQGPRTHKTLCIRHTWPPSRVRESSAQVYTPLCATVSALHTYDPLAPPLHKTATVSSTHPHRAGARTVVTTYGTTQAPARGHVVPVGEGYRYPEGETRDRSTTVRAAPRRPGEATEPARTTWKPNEFGPTTGTYVHIGRRSDATKGTPLALLQSEIDDFCTERFRELCASRGGRFCTSSPIVGRYGPGGANDAGGWRCYNKDEMSMETRSLGCVDECGSLMRCLGAAGPNTTSIAVPELDAWVLQRKWQHCSAYQQAADALCNFKTSGDLARYDMLRKRWMCLDLDDIAFEGQSYCVDNCGAPIPCVGGLIPGLVPKYTVHIVQHPDMERAFEAIQPCPDLNDICIATVLNPPRCVKQSTTILIQRLSAQQERLDEECQQDRDDACRRKTLQEECFRLWLARYDMGPTGEARAWRCYPESALDFTHISRCTDGCGNLVPCRGAPVTPTPLAVDVPRRDQIMADLSYCSAYQLAANNYCKHKYGRGFVARQHCQTLRWQCLNQDRLPSLEWTGCVGHCGESTSCPAGVDESVEIPNIEDPGLVRAITSVADPCPPGEKCEPTKQAPPFCSISRPRTSNSHRDNE